MVFGDGEEMYDAIEIGDLYSIEKELYVFLYNSDGAVCVYNITPDEANELQRKSEKSDEYWGAFLGIGGSIYDNPMEFCAENYQGNWCKCEDVFKSTAIHCGLRKTGTAFRRKMSRKKYKKRLKLMKYAAGGGCGYIQGRMSNNGIWKYSNHIQYPSHSRIQSFYKKYSNKKVRRYNGELNNGNHYRRVFDYWWTID